MPNQLMSAVGAILDVGKRFGHTRCRRRAVFHQANENAVAVKFDELAGNKRVGKIFRQQFGVGRADAKTDHGAGVAKHGLPNFGR